MKWRIEVSETVTQQTVYVIEAESKEQAKELVQGDETDLEQLSIFVEDRAINTVISAELYPEDL